MYCTMRLYNASTVVHCRFYGCIFFFKQKTAYEMRISDWSSDVCSSDLLGDRRAVAVELQPVGARGLGEVQAGTQRFWHGGATGRLHPDEPARSEEHTSELQSLMRISYAVFCLKKKKNITTTQMCRH